MNEQTREQEEFEQLAKSPWDNSTAILYITTHGYIVKLNHLCAPEYTRIPEGMNITLASAAAPGEVNFMDAKTADAYVSLINANKRNLMSNLESTRDFAIQRIVDAMKRNDESNLIDAELFERPDFPGYMHHFDKSYSIEKLQSPDLILDKNFSRRNYTDPEYFSDNADEITKNDFVVKVMNIAGGPDLVSFLRRSTRRQFVEIRMKEILEFLRDKGVENVIIFDMSCSNLEPDMFAHLYDERRKRRERREILGKRKRGGAGKKSKRKRISKRKRWYKRRTHKK